MYTTIVCLLWMLYLLNGYYLVYTSVFYGGFIYQSIYISIHWKEIWWMLNFFSSHNSWFNHFKVLIITEFKEGGLIYTTIICLQWLLHLLLDGFYLVYKSVRRPNEDGALVRHCHPRYPSTHGSNIHRWTIITKDEIYIESPYQG